MGRPRKFERDDALQRALGIFWMQGYAATKMSDLQRAMGIGRQSLYDTFGGKDEVFTEALELYLQRNRQMVVRLLVPDQGLAAIRSYLVATAENMASKPRKACFLFNTCVELGPHDEDTRERLSEALERMRRGFAGCLDFAQADGALSPDADVSRLSTFLVAQVGGMAALARAGAPAADLVAIATTATSALR